MTCGKTLRACAKITWHFGASVAQADARRRDAVDATAHRRGAATQQMLARRRAPSGCGQAAKCQVIFAQTLKATSRTNRESREHWTSPIPPTPISGTISYGPNFVPGAHPLPLAHLL